MVDVVDLHFLGRRLLRCDAMRCDAMRCDAVSVPVCVSLIALDGPTSFSARWPISLPMALAMAPIKLSALALPLPPLSPLSFRSFVTLSTMFLETSSTKLFMTSPVTRQRLGSKPATLGRPCP